MNKETVFEQLMQIKLSTEFIDLAEGLTSEWSNQPNQFEAVEPVLRFMESNPDLDYGMPGPLVHFVESFYGIGYEGKLVESIERQPTPHTVWMLNRVINGTKNKEERKRLILILERAGKNASADRQTRDSVTRFLRFIESASKH